MTGRSDQWVGCQDLIWTECIWVSSDKVDEPRIHYTEWSESERER